MRLNSICFKLNLASCLGHRTVSGRGMSVKSFVMPNGSYNRLFLNHKAPSLGALWFVRLKKEWFNIW
jgi:hypothetical protein